MIITATLMIVAVMESRMIKRENDFCWLNAIRLAMKLDIFTYNFLIPTLNKPFCDLARLVKIVFRKAIKFFSKFCLCGTQK
jgi:hypothetical protein